MELKATTRLPASIAKVSWFMLAKDACSVTPK